MIRDTGVTEEKETVNAFKLSDSGKPRPVNGTIIKVIPSYQLTQLMHTDAIYKLAST